MATQNPRRMGKTDNKLERPYQRLCAEVVAQACKDYRHALLMKKRGQNRHGKGYRNAYYQYMNADDAIKECEDWFRNDLDLWCDLDGEWAIQKIRERVDND